MRVLQWPNIMPEDALELLRAKGLVLSKSRTSPYDSALVHGPALPDRLLNFNLAHSRGVALYAFTRLGQIGVDIEFIRPEFPDRHLSVKRALSRGTSSYAKQSI